MVTHTYVCDHCDDLYPNQLFVFGDVITKVLDCLIIISVSDVHVHVHNIHRSTTDLVSVFPYSLQW